MEFYELEAESNTLIPEFYNQRAYSGERNTKIKKVPSRSLSPNPTKPTVLYK